MISYQFRPPRRVLPDVMAPAAPKDPRAVELGEWLMQQRLALGLKRPEAVRLALKHDAKADLSPDYLSKLEYGTRSLATAALDVREAIRQALGIKAETWQAQTGLIVPGHEPESPPSAPQRPLPETLLEASERYGDLHQALRNPKILHQLSFVRGWDGVPRTPEDWVEFYLDNRRRFRE